MKLGFLRIGEKPIDKLGFRICAFGKREGKEPQGDAEGNGEESRHWRPEREREREKERESDNRGNKFSI